VWDAATGQELVRLKHIPQVGILRAVAFSPDGLRLATAGLSGTVTVWDGSAGGECLALKGDGSEVPGVAFSPDGTRLATARRDGTVKLWSASTGRELLTLKGHPREVQRVAFSADGKRVASASWDGMAKVWDADTGECLFTLKGRSGNIFCVAFSPDGTRLATGGQDAVVRAWDAGTGREMLTLKGHSQLVQAVAFSPDGRSLVGRDTGGNILAWDAATGQPLPDARATAVSMSHPAISGDRLWLAHIDNDVVYLRDLRRPVDEDELAFSAAQARLDPYWQDEQAGRCEQSGQWFGVAFHLDRAVSAWPRRPSLLLRRGRALAELGRWEKARDDFARAAEQIPEEPEAWRGLALSELALNRPDAYRGTCRRFVERWGRSTEVAVMGLLFSSTPGNAPGLAGLTWEAVNGTPARVAACRATARTCVLQRDALAEPALLLPLVGGDPLLRGAVLYRAGHPEEAVQALRGNKDAIALLYRALAESGRGKKDAAKQVLDEAVRWLEAPSAEPNLTNVQRLPWEKRLEAHLLRKEAEGLLRGDGAGDQN
jgi:tetratricopeptide (TPR) repeat protein